MAKGKFGQTMEVAAEGTAKAAKSPTAQWVGIIGTLLATLSATYLSQDKSSDIEGKAKASESATVEAVEANSRSIMQGVQALQSLQADSVRSRAEVRKVIGELQRTVVALNDRVNTLTVDHRVSEAVREKWKEMRRHRVEAGEEALVGPRQPEAKKVEVDLTPMPEASGDDAAKEVKQMKAIAHPRLVRRVWEGE